MLKKVKSDDLKSKFFLTCRKRCL